MDDIVVVISPKPHEAVEDYFKRIKITIDDDKLSIKENKSEWFDYTGIESKFSFDYLGYKFSKNGKILNLSISDKKKEKYKKRIRLAIKSYVKNSVKQPKKSKKELFMRLKYLTTNTRLSNNKGNALIGIYNTNKWVTDNMFLKNLDDFLIGNSNSIPDEHVKNKILNFSFSEGFLNRKFSHFSSKDFETIVKAWKQ